MSTKRTLARRIAPLAAGLFVLLGAAPAFAAKPEAWPVAENGSDFGAIFRIAAWTVGAYVIIWLLAALPGILQSNKFDESTAFVDQPEWFGGPSAGASAAKSPDESTETGGASANW